VGTSFYDTIRDLDIPAAEIAPRAEPLSPSVADSEHATPLSESTLQRHRRKHWHWMGPLLGVLLFVGAVGLVYWEGTRLRNAAAAELEQTMGKLNIVAKYGNDVSVLSEEARTYDRRLDSSWAVFAPWHVASVRAKVEFLDDEVDKRYGSILENERKTLTERLESLEEHIGLAAGIDYPSKADVIAFSQDVRERVDAGTMTIPQVGSYLQAMDAKEKTMNEELLTVLQREFSRLETKMAAAVNYDFPSRPTISSYVQRKRTAVTDGSTRLDDTIALVTDTQSNMRLLDGEVEEAKKKLILATVTTTTKEVDTLLAFFAQRNGYDMETSLLTQYKNNVSAFTTDTYARVGSDELKSIADRDLFALLTVPRASKTKAEEKEKQERLALQKKLQEESGIPVPALEAPKLIHVDIATQRLYAYENGISIFSAPVPVTTGKAGFETVRGQFSIVLKTTNTRLRSPFPGISYDSFVSYWMPFFQGYGLHDASWRTVYGTMDYLSVGSHGCVNIPFNDVQKLYFWAEVGTVVLVT
jgi:lipoprotein-anchoring transpeptidase ErfK/SrfK